MKQAFNGEECAHPEIATSLYDLGRVYCDLGKHGEAVKTYERSITMNQAIYGEECAHPHIAISFNNLELVYHGEGKLKEVIEGDLKNHWKYK